jgi:voltage-gated sodium channel
VLDAQYKQQSSERFDDFVLYINLLFTGIFAIELGINMFANWMYKFVRNGWNWLDLFIVLMSLLDFGPFDNPLWLVRLMRAFRVVRLFGRVHELTKMISAITASLFPMLNAFVILLVVLSICELLRFSNRINSSCSIFFGI